MGTYYLPDENGWSPTGGGTYSTRLRLRIVNTYDLTTNTSAVSIETQVQNSALNLTWSSINTAYQKLTVNGADYGVDNDWRARTRADDTWVTLSKGNQSALNLTLAHAEDGIGTLNINVRLYLYGYVSETQSYHSIFADRSGTVTIRENRGSSIASCPASLRTLDAFSLSVTRYRATHWHVASFKVGNNTLYTSAAFETALRFTVPRAWFADYPNDGALSVAVSVQTYADESCTQTVGVPATATVTVEADGGMAPALAPGYASAAADNTGSAASGISGYVQGYSKALVTLDPTKLTLSDVGSPTVASVTVTGAGVTASAAPYRTGTLTGETVITVTVTDSRGLKGTQTLTVTPMSYAPPTVTGDVIFRCDSLGLADESGNYVSVKAVGNLSALGGQNTLTLTAQTAQGGGSYGAAQALTNGLASVLGGALDPDTKLSVKVTATDALGNSAEIVRTLPNRLWAMKFRPDGLGVGFGKIPEFGGALELPAGWALCVGNARLLITETDIKLQKLTGGTWTDVWSSV